MTIAHFLSNQSCCIHMACPQQMSSCEVLVGFHGRELILEESFLGVHLVSFSYLRYWLHIEGSFLTYFLWIEHCSSKIEDFYVKKSCSHQLLQGGLLRWALPFGRLLRISNIGKIPHQRYHH